MSGIPIYRIRDWKLHFESSESIKRVKALTWVATPTKHDGKAFRRIMRRDPTGAMIGVWNMLVQVAAKCPVRGTLADQDGPLTAIDISDKTGLSEEAVQNGFAEFSSQEIRWLECLNQENVRENKEQDNTGHNKTIQPTGVAADHTGIAADSAGVPADLSQGNKRQSFTIPDINDIAAYCAERNNQVDAQQFFDHYSANGWMVGRVKMKDWKATVRNWEKRSFGTGQKAIEKLSPHDQLMAERNGNGQH